jgi:hypothetical protein
MKFDIISCLETDSGLIFSLDVDEEGRQYLMERGFNAVLTAVLTDIVKEMEEDHEREPPEGI